jgi:hypothetical protein
MSASTDFHIKQQLVIVFDTRKLRANQIQRCMKAVYVDGCMDVKLSASGPGMPKAVVHVR